MKVQSILIASIAAIGFSVLTPAAAEVYSTPAVVNLAYTADQVSSQGDLYTDVKFHSRKGFRRGYRGHSRHGTYNRGYRSSRGHGYYNNYYGQYKSKRGYYGYDKHGSYGVRKGHHGVHGGKSFKHDKRIHKSHGVVIKKKIY